MGTRALLRAHGQCGRSPPGAAHGQSGGGREWVTGGEEVHRLGENLLILMSIQVLCYLFFCSAANFLGLALGALYAKMPEITIGNEMICQLTIGRIREFGIGTCYWYDVIVAM